MTAPTGTRAREPLFEVMRHQERSYLWLARRTGYSHSYIKAVAAGQRPASPDFRARSAYALDLPESVLFHATPKPRAEAAAAS